LLAALLCYMAAVASAAVSEQVFRWEIVSAAVGGCVGGMVLVIGIAFVLYDFTCRNYFSGRAGEYFRLDQEVAAGGSSTKL